MMRIRAQIGRDFVMNSLIAVPTAIEDIIEGMTPVAHVKRYLGYGIFLLEP